MTKQQYYDERVEIVLKHGGDRAAELLNRLRCENPEHSSIEVRPLAAYHFWQGPLSQSEQILQLAK